jgi:hypothetical protein
VAMVSNAVESSMKGLKHQDKRAFSSGFECAVGPR